MPEQFIKGLTTARLQGRAQIVSDQYINTEGPGDLVFYLDGAHSPESMEVCATWFSDSIKKDEPLVNSIEYPPADASRRDLEMAGKSSTQVIGITSSLLSIQNYNLWRYEEQ